jgi:D-alanyl-lipoteichoic acid acyltransferase DltB (MBOAT superfamily)
MNGAPDESLWYPIWLKSRRTIKWFAILLIPFTLISYPLSRLYVYAILSRSPFSPTSIEDAAFLGISTTTFTTVSLVISQASSLLEYALRRELKKARTVVYEETVRSRGKRKFIELSLRQNDESN